MALTLTELMIVPGTGNKRMSWWKITGDGTSYQINVRDLKMAKIEAAIVENITNDQPITIRTENYDYLAGPVNTLELGREGGALDLDKIVILLVIGY